MLRPNNLKCGGKKKHQLGGKIDMSQFYNQPVINPFDTMNYNGDEETALHETPLVPEKKTPATPKSWNQSLGIGMMGLRSLTSEIAGRVERARQNQYDYTQQAALGQMNPMPASDYQPNPYSLYAKYGGSLKKYGGLQHVNYFGPAFSNGAKMNMGDEDKMDVKASHAVMSKLLRGFKKGGISIKPENRGKFTASAKAHGMSVQEFASKVLANKEDYSPTQVKRANFARNAKGWKKEGGLTANKAREILHDGTAQGHPLTDKQRRFFGAKSKGHTNFKGK